MRKPGAALLAVVLVASLLAACSAVSAAPSASSRELTVFAASSLTDPFQELTRGFGEARVSYNFGGSPQLRTQLEQGARADVFASANREQMELARRDGVIVGEAPVFAQNRLVVIVPKMNPGSIERLEGLARPGLKLVITTADVPIGAYTREALRKMSADPRFGPDYADRVLANVVSEESNVKQLVAKVQLGEADAAWVYSTDVSPSVARDVRTITVPDTFNAVADYPVAVVKGTTQSQLARAFIAYLFSDPARATLRTYGFALPAQGVPARFSLRQVLSS